MKKYRFYFALIIVFIGFYLLYSVDFRIGFGFLLIHLGQFLTPRA